MESDKQLRVGIVGCGYLGQTVGKEFRERTDTTVVAVVDISEEARRDAGEILDVPDESQYAHYEAALENESLDAVLIGTPHTLHYEQISLAMDRGIHVLCDKPLTTDLEHARELRSRARTSDSVLMVGYQRHLNPAFINARERWADDGPTPEWITAEVSQNWLEDHVGTWRLKPELSGGGYLYDTGSHVLDAILWTTGLTPTAVSARMTFADDEERIDEWADVTIEFEEGTRASVTTYASTPAVREHIHVWDDEGAVYIEGVEWEPRKLTVIDEESGEYQPYIERADYQSKAAPFIEAIRTGAEPPATAQDGLRVTAVTEAAYESAANDGEWVSLDPADMTLE